MSLKSSGDGPTVAVRASFISRFSVFSLGVLASLDGVYYGWNQSLSVGIGSFAIVLFLVSLAYFILYCCLSELSSTLPFPGGSYGFARCSVGFYGGYLVGCFEVFYYIMLAMIVNADVVAIIMDANPEFQRYSLAFMVCFLVLQMGLCTTQSIFWRYVCVLSLLSIAVMTFYCIDSLTVTDFAKYAVQDSANGQAFVGGAADIIRQLPVGLYFYIGNEIANIFCDEVKLPRVDIPFAQVGVAALLIVFAFFVSFSTASSAPGIGEAAELDYPLIYGKLSNRSCL
jgi:ethanolamine permease